METILPALPYPFPDIPRIRFEAIADLKPWKKEGLPVVIEGALKDWPVRRELSERQTVGDKLRYLTGLFGETQVKVTSLPRDQGGHLGYHPGSSQRNFSEQETPFTTFSAQLERALLEPGAPGVYMQAQATRTAPGFEAALKPSPFFGATEVAERNVWIGSGNHTVTLHFDQYDNYIAMLEGQKRITVFPPECLPDLYVGPLDRGPADAPASLVRLLAPDFERFPRFRNALPLGQGVILQPGEVLFVPPLWWHHVESFGLNVMVNMWVHDIKRQLFHEFGRILGEGIVLFQGVPQDLRERFRLLYRWMVFRDPSRTFTLQSELASRLSQEQQKGLTQHLFTCASLFDRLPPAWQRQLSAFFDYFLFQTSGVPLETLPGEFDKMVERFRADLGARP